MSDHSYRHNILHSHNLLLDALRGSLPAAAPAGRIPRRQEEGEGSPGCWMVGSDHDCCSSLRLLLSNHGQSTMLVSVWKHQSLPCYSSHHHHSPQHPLPLQCYQDVEVKADCGCVHAATQCSQKHLAQDQQRQHEAGQGCSVPDSNSRHQLSVASHQELFINDVTT